MVSYLGPVTANGAAPLAGLAQPRGFRMPPREMRITFEDGSAYHGAELRCTMRLSLGQTLALQRMTASGEGGDIESAARTFAETVLLDWNLVDDDGAPIPATPENFLVQPADFIVRVINYWQQGVTQPDAPLASPSPSGAPSPEPDEMTVLS